MIFHRPMFSIRSRYQIRDLNLPVHAGPGPRRELGRRRWLSKSTVSNPPRELVFQIPFPEAHAVAVAQGIPDQFCNPPYSDHLILPVRERALGVIDYSGSPEFHERGTAWTSKFFRTALWLLQTTAPMAIRSRYAIDGGWEPEGQRLTSAHRSAIL
jgi:hypothetical protein